jgi:signal transduction histidine kinase
MGGGTVKFYLHILKEHKIYRHLKTSKCICYSWDQWVMKYYPERVDELIEIIQRNAKRLQTLIGNIRDVTKIESNANTKYGII